jgi:hypothetical protein
MADTQLWPVSTDTAGYLYRKVKDAWTKIGTAPVYNGARLYPAHADDNAKLCCRFQGRFQLVNGHPAATADAREPLALHVDDAGQLYTFHAGTYTKVMLT